jgi:serpin B
MHRRSLLMSATAFALCACASPPSVSAGDDGLDETSGAGGGGGDAFDVALYRAVAAEPGNQFVSPYSVAAAFTLLYPGAEGETAAEIAAVFGFDASAETEARSARAEAEALAGQAGGSELSIANAAWVERTMSLRPDYQRAIRDILGGVIEPVDFIANQAAALRRINEWASRETRGRIEEILTEPDASRRLVLTNAVYFKGRWRRRFSAEATEDGVFYTGASTSTPARLMRQEARTRYFETADVQAAEFDYDEGAFALAVFLPRQRMGLEAFERGLTGAGLDGYMERLAGADDARLDITLPKVEMRAEYSLVPQLQAMGLHRAFSSNAEFAAITADASLAVSDVIHKTFLAIDEEGTEAAAVTAVDIRVTAAPMPPPAPPIEFKADHPFFIVLHHKPTRTRLFMGRVASV